MRATSPGAAAMMRQALVFTANLCVCPRPCPTLPPSLRGSAMGEWLVQECWVGGVQNWMWSLALAFALYLAVLAVCRTYGKRAH